MSPRPLALTSLTLTLLCGLACGLVACSGQERAPRSASTSPGARPAPATTMSAVERSTMRERALEVLESQAFSEWALARANAIEGLLLAPGRVEPMIRAGLADENPGVRSIAAMAAGELVFKEAEAAVRPLLRDPEPRVRASAIYALVSMGARVDRTPLANQLEHRDPRVRAHAAVVLGKLGDPSAIPLLRAAVRSRTLPPGTLGRFFSLQAAEAMVKLGDDLPINSIRAALYPDSTEGFEVATLAAQILGDLQDQGSAAQLVQIVEAGPAARTPEEVAQDAGRGRPAELRLAAATALAEMGYPDGWYLADEFLEDPISARRQQAAHLLGAAAVPGALERLEPLLEDEDPLVRIAAAASIVRVLEPGTVAGG
jgi:HEAT repeat protein